MTDRLEEIKARVAYHVPGGDMPWLIAEVERLRGHRDTSDEMCELQTEMKIRALDEFLALRGALQALVDATAMRSHAFAEAPWLAARAVAVGLLAGPGGET